MQIRVLGCSGSIAMGSRTTSFLLGQHVLVDAGTGVGDLSLDELARIDHVFLTHSHLDHVLGVGLMADSVSRRRNAGPGRGPITVHALPETIEALQTHIFNGVVWPDFSQLPTPAAPLLRFSPVAVGQRVTLAETDIEVLSAAHTVPAVGYAVFAPGRHDKAWVFTGDTGPNPALWQRLATINVAHLVIETAFGNEEAALADVSKHLRPETLAHELAQLHGKPQVHITHIKPGEVTAVMAQILALNLPWAISPLQAGQTFELLA
jgi:ribonuclease BN (tRNA processing enzyme)